MRAPKILIVIMSILLMFLLVACNSTETINTDNPTTSESHTKSENAPETPNSTEISKVDKTEECRKALEDIEVELLAITSEPYEDAEINGYLVYSEDYETATLLTIGVKLNKDTYYNYYSGITICGETATGNDAKPAVQTSYNASWISNNKDYALLVLRIGGDIDPSKVTVTLKGKVDGVTVDTRFDNNGEPIGFDDAKTYFADKDDVFGCESSIVKLKGRHYLIIRRYKSSSGWGGGSTTEYSTNTLSYVLVPIEQGFAKTLTKEDVKMVISGSVENTEGILMVNQNGRIDMSSMEKQTTLEVEFKRTVVEQRNDDDTFDNEVYKKIDDDIKELSQMTTLEIDDGDGNIVILKMK